MEPVQAVASIVAKILSMNPRVQPARCRGNLGGAVALVRCSWSQCLREGEWGAFHEPSEAPPGFGVRQSSGALAMEASRPKAPEDWRTARRYRAVRRFMVPMRGQEVVQAFQEPTHHRPLPGREQAFVRVSLVGPGAAKVARYRSAVPEYRENVFVDLRPRVINHLCNTKRALRSAIRRRLDLGPG